MSTPRTPWPAPDPAVTPRHVITAGGLWTAPFWRAVVERAIKTAAQTAVATIGTTAALDQVQWRTTGMIVALATILSILTSIATAAATDGSPSAANEALTTGVRQEA
nr:MAG TPA: holin [Caudoviricetes sp.]